MTRGWMVWGVCVAAAWLGGCGIGKNKMLMVTKTNIGIAAETTPQPNAEISSSRSEALIAPVFADGRTPAAIAGISVASDTGVFQSGIGSAFAVGDAAMTLTNLDGDQNAVQDATLAAVTIHEPGDQHRPGWVEPMLEPRPVFFATDTAFGLKAVWGGTAGYYPDRVVLGYNRKEGTLAPLQALEDPTNPGTYTIDAPSLIATVTIGATAGTNSEENPLPNAGFKQQQFFATGAAATRLGTLREVRESVFRQVDPLLAASISAVSTEAGVIQRHLYDDPSQTGLRESNLRTWLGSQTPRLTITQLLTLETADADRLRRAYVQVIVPAPVTYSATVSDLRGELTVPGRSDERKQLIRDIISQELTAERERDASVRPWPTIRDAGGATRSETDALLRARERVVALGPEPVSDPDPDPTPDPVEDE